MTKSKKTVIITVSIVAFIVLIFALGRVSFEIFKDKLENNIFPLKDPISVINTEYKRNDGIIVDWIYNPNDLKQLAGFADYVFVAEVKEVIGTGYVNMYDTGFETHPFTKYKIRVLKNIKGNLKTDEDIDFYKNDGVEYFGKKVTLYQGDMLPDVSECYIFLCKADENGELIIGSFGGHNDIYLCEADEYTGEEKLIEVYSDAVANMDESVRFGERYKSKYEVQ